jgi:hypothetical protein
MTDDMTITVDGDEYVLRREGDDLQVGRRVAGDVAWLDTVALGLLPRPAREALESGNGADESLLTAVRGIAQAEEDRGA